MAERFRFGFELGCDMRFSRSESHDDCFGLSVR